MKKSKRIFEAFIAIIMIVSLIMTGVLRVFAHSAMLDVEYDNCVDDDENNGIDETWYILDRQSQCDHLSHETLTIKYYFEEYSEDGTYTWTTNSLVDEDEATKIKTAYANSMKKWNNVYFYSYDTNGTITKNKVINVIEGTATDHNLSIYPAAGTPNQVETIPVTGTYQVIEGGTVIHSHWSEWKMTVYVQNFFANGSVLSSAANRARERVGAHEIGHILGVFDVDTYCSESTPATDDDHHDELLMGYGDDRATDITYKDIAGVAITRGFHADDDHQWLLYGGDKLICAICNGVKAYDGTSNETYSLYNMCFGNHTLSSGNMMAVACYGDQDYYKCKYCRYVAEFDQIVDQMYFIYPYSSTQHECVNTVEGLEYTLYEDHDMTDNGCLECGYLHTHAYGAYEYRNQNTHRATCACGAARTEAHSYTAYTYYNNISHRKTCICGSALSEAHYIRQSEIVNGRYAPCKGCGRMLDLWEDIANYQSLGGKVSLNGSYILPSGIIVLVDEDVEAYLNGTLQFYDEEDLPVTE